MGLKMILSYRGANDKIESFLCRDIDENKMFRYDFVQILHKIMFLCQLIFLLNPFGTCYRNFYFFS